MMSSGRCSAVFFSTNKLPLLIFFWIGSVYFSNMMTSSSGNIFRVSGHLSREFTGHRWIHRTKASDAGLWWELQLFQNTCRGLLHWAFLVKLPSSGYNKSRWCLVLVMVWCKVITSIDDDQVLWHHMASRGHNVLMWTSRVLPDTSLLMRHIWFLKNTYRISGNTLFLSCDTQCNIEITAKNSAAALMLLRSNVYLFEI